MYRALFTQKKLDHDALLEILGPRPQMEKSLYEEFIKNKIYFDETTTLLPRQFYKTKKILLYAMVQKIKIYEKFCWYCLKSKPLSDKDSPIIKLFNEQSSYDTTATFRSEIDHYYYFSMSLIQILFIHSIITNNNQCRKLPIPLLKKY